MLLEYHHAKEEDLLFPLILKTTIPRSGGANCSQYFSPRVIEQSLFNSYGALNEALKCHGTVADVTDTDLRKLARSQNSPLMVPIEDHICGARAAQWIQPLVDRGDPLLLEVFIRFSDFLRDHIEREDNCLFLQCERTFTWELKDSYKKSYEALEQKQTLSWKDLLTQLLPLLATEKV